MAEIGGERGGCFGDSYCTALSETKGFSSGLSGLSQDETTETRPATGLLRSQVRGYALPVHRLCPDEDALEACRCEGRPRSYKTPNPLITILILVTIAIIITVVVFYWVSNIVRMVGGS